jgi:hypothetical protein
VGRPAVETSVVCIGVGSCVLPNVPAETRARLQRCSRLTSPMIRLLRGVCQHPSPFKVNVPWWSDSLATPAGSLGAEARAASHGYKAACNCRRVFQIRRYTPPATFLLRPWAVEYSRPRRKDSPITAWTARKSVPSEDKCWHRPDSSTVCTFGPIAFGPAALLHSPASGDGRDWPWPERASPTARSVAEKHLSSVK